MKQLGELMAEAVDGLRAMAEQVGVVLNVIPSDAQVWGDPDRLLQVMTNLLAHAIKFSPPSGDLGTILTSLPDQVYDALPYLVTIVILAGVVGRSIPPAADGQAYEREAAT